MSINIDNVSRLAVKNDLVFSINDGQFEFRINVPEYVYDNYQTGLLLLLSKFLKDADFKYSAEYDMIKNFKLVGDIVNHLTVCDEHFYRIEYNRKRILPLVAKYSPIIESNLKLIVELLTNTINDINLILIEYDKLLAWAKKYVWKYTEECKQKKQERMNKGVRIVDGIPIDKDGKFLLPPLE